MSNYLFVTEKEIKEFIKNYDTDQFYMVNIGDDIKVSTTTPNVFEMDGLVPTALHEQMLKSTGDATKDRKKYIKRYKATFYNDNNVHGLNVVLSKAEKYNMKLAFMVSTRELKSGYPEVIFNYLKETFNMKGYSYDEFIRNPDVLHSKMSTEARTVLEEELLKRSMYNGTAKDTVITARIKIPYENPLLVYEMSFKDLEKIGIHLGISYRGGNKDKYRYKICQSIKKNVLNSIPDDDILPNLSVNALRQLLISYGITTPSDSSTDELLDKVKDLRTKLTVDKVPNMSELTAMSAREIDLLAKDNKINTTNKTKTQLISEILEVNGITVSKEATLTKEYLKSKSEEDLMIIATNQGLDIPSFLGKKRLISLILKSQKYKESIEKAKQLSYSDLEDMAASALIKLAIDLEIVDNEDDVYNNDISRRQIIRYIENVAGVEYSRPEIEIPPKGELKAMEKHKVKKLANKLGLHCMDFESKKDIINSILNYEKELKEKKADENSSNKKKNTLVSKETLKSKNRSELLEFCKRNSIDYDPIWSKKEFIAHIYEVYKALEKGSNLNDLSEEVDEDEFTYENFLQCSRKDLIRFCKFNSIPYGESNSKEALAYKIMNVINPDAVIDLELSEEDLEDELVILDEEYDLEPKDSKKDNESKKAKKKDKYKKGRDEILGDFSDIGLETNYEFIDLVVDLETKSKKKKKNESVEVDIIQDGDIKKVKKKRNSPSPYSGFSLYGDTKDFSFSDFMDNDLFTI